ncbi:MAG: hypothetical protein WAN87_03640 [Thermoplasmata archaeon]
MAEDEVRSDLSTNMFHDFLTALDGKQGQLEIRLQNFSVRVPMLRESFEVTGNLTIVAHMRGMSDKERQAYVQKNLKDLK